MHLSPYNYIDVFFIKTYYSSSYIKSILKYGCYNAASALILFSGSNSNNSFNKLISSFSNLYNYKILKSILHILFILNISLDVLPGNKSLLVTLYIKL